jgi:hypothetical protein
MEREKSVIKLDDLKEHACANRYHRYLMTKSADELTRMKRNPRFSSAEKNRYKTEIWSLVAREAGLPEAAVENMYWEFRESTIMKTACSNPSQNVGTTVCVT